MTTTTLAAPFTDYDWHGFAGCEPWPNGDRPLIREVPGGTLLVADKNGIGAYRSDDNDTDAWMLNVEFPTQRAAEIFLNGWSEGDSPEALGFTQP